MITFNTYNQTLLKYMIDISVIILMSIYGNFTQFSDAILHKMRLERGPDGKWIMTMPMSGKGNKPPKKLPQYYCFSTGRHAGSFFLKVIKLLIVIYYY